MTILDACTEVLAKAKSPLTVEQIYNEITRNGLYDFKAKDPRSIVRGTLRKHLRGLPPHRVRQVDSNSFRVA